jgi:PilZ domain
VNQERRGLRFAFSAGAELAPESSPAAFAPARVTELSLRGCFLETPASFEVQQPVWVKIYGPGQFFEAEAAVLYVKPSGLGLEFREIKPQFRAVLQQWILSALHKQTDASPTE